MNWLLFASVVVIALAGILFVNGAGYLQPEHRYWQQQAKWAGIGLVVCGILLIARDAARVEEKL